MNKVGSHPKVGVAHGVSLTDQAESGSFRPNSTTMVSGLVFAGSAANGPHLALGHLLTAGVMGLETTRSGRGAGSS